MNLRESVTYIQYAEFLLLFSYKDCTTPLYSSRNCRISSLVGLGGGHLPPRACVFLLFGGAMMKKSLMMAVVMVMIMVMQEAVGTSSGEEAPRCCCCSSSSSSCEQPSSSSSCCCFSHRLASAHGADLERPAELLYAACSKRGKRDRSYNDSRHHEQL